MNNVHIVTLGCSKNDVDSSMMYSLLDKNKYQMVNEPSQADILIVNTCGFIDAAKEESIDTILESVEYKNEGRCKKVLLSGCLAQRYPEELIKEIPEIDGIIGTGNIDYINELLDRSLAGDLFIKTDNLNSAYIEGIRKEVVNTTEYVKISEGCNNNCSYCIIPSLRGKNRSRKIEDIYSEVEYLVSKGAREIILIAQNTTDYGIDLYSKYSLANLINKISKIEDLKWIRVLYLYPDHFTDELIEEFKNNDKLVNYVDMPLQHISDDVLKRMNRKTSKEHIIKTLKNLRKSVPDIVIRTTFIVGFPGESDDDFNQLVDFIEDIKFDKLGVFEYSKEEGTRAASLDEQIPDSIKEERKNEIMAIQSEISAEILSKKIGKKLEVLIEEEVDEENYVGRTYMDSPEIDGVTYVHSAKNLEMGSFVQIDVVDSLDYDLVGEII
ncbi:MAG: 30S ribosomal protein S12 methylthiotransferase RimO [Peptoniphilus harei]|uniref:Ribosomal protein uS12 methylthiotransferase RimO n=1 Tax=Peptoniphilus harei ACS-146-V-Sch2b TaxID=908338 RepID=E4KYJ4_9FIRM|nr:30S ribosomal protein S12 methylthiotransferase RimO [Peptoniphilus harei]EFR33097.1 ribosomal protein S12 methylthiotransferase RimO [Peptoniphilus harei ACS-146-V-Sch2b]MDK7755164.1 30S ribosomal protein S12 methylthiotransferase RimO [Peptoniphilus harei]MDK7760971.1 30S ribosomal protein S12 methylthiotransferase RimO [Peptoniphilus harei]MDK8270761.1 30S ribosomal protein S12 methylthiotransferase RimO [Peptoniphilus harei]MDK8339144.1 30S ribosomal protein S12 methylthiotransferase Ri